MALRVLLGDESSTIKKVMQLALQDFGVEVRSCPSGSEILKVVESYRPEIIFVDVLLAKKSGYEVCREIKMNSQLGSIPVVLLWSGFLELDPGKVKGCQADGTLEKPFDAHQLRSLVQGLVKTVQGNQIADYIDFPELPLLLEDDEKIEGGSESGTSILEDGEEFQSVPLPKLHSATEGKMSPEFWSHRDLSQFRIPLPPEDSEGIDASSGVPASPPPPPHSASPQELPPPPFHSSSQPSLPPLPSPLHPLPPLPPPPSLPSEQEIEEIVRVQVQRKLDEVIWRVLPDLAERVLREEIQKLIQEKNQDL